MKISRLVAHPRTLLPSPVRDSMRERAGRCLLMALAALIPACGDAGGGSAGGSTSDDPDATAGDMPTTAGTETTNGSNSGSASDATTDPTSGGTTDPFAHDPVCSSEKMWTMGNTESPHMHPGVACLACHTQMEPGVAAQLPLLGTVFPTGHEPDDCLGSDGTALPIFVEITTADAKVLQLPVNNSGNFLYDADESGPLMFPITAKVVQGDKERPMLSPQNTGDCNSCHTQMGTNGAPGRIVAP